VYNRYKGIGLELPRVCQSDIIIREKWRKKKGPVLSKNLKGNRPSLRGENAKKEGGKKRGDGFFDERGFINRKKNQGWVL